jgi:murein L,D-transpeptidase YcbB/YkuD
MRSLAICLALSVMLAAGTGAAHAQEAVTVNGTQAMRVVIAPPDSPLAGIMKARLGDAYYGAKPGTKAYSDAQKLYYFYGSRHFEPLWVTMGTDGTVAFTPAAEKIIGVFRNAASEGFRPEDYLTPAIDITAVGSDTDKVASLETAFSTATLKYAHDAYLGRVAPQDVSAAIDPETKKLDAAALLVKLATSDSPDQVLASLDPTDKEFLELKAALARIDSGESAPTPIAVPSGPMLRLGMTDPRVPVLRQRLELPAPDVEDNVYGPDLVAAVKAFQSSAGETADGILGPATLAALNKGTTSKISREDIVANMERWRWLPHDLGQFHVLVNIPEFRVSVVENDNVDFSTRVVVGKPSTPTPMFSNSIKNIVVNPYWNVPASIISKEIAPHMLSNPGYIASQNMQVLYNGKPIDPYSVDWSANVPVSVRQLPGPGNALGQIKFLFPNDHDVYLHDTPSKSLFANSVRAYSHGCVRVQNPMDFANALLKYEPGLSVAKLESMFGSTERWVNLKTYVPVHIAYFTVRVAPDGTLHSYGDIYGHNKKLIGLLNGTEKPAAPSKTPIVSGV